MSKKSTNCERKFKSKVKKKKGFGFIVRAKQRQKKRLTAHIRIALSSTVAFIRIQIVPSRSSSVSEENRIHFVFEILYQTKQMIIKTQFYYYLDSTTRNTQRFV